MIILNFGFSIVILSSALPLSSIRIFMLLPNQGPERTCLLNGKVKRKTYIERCMSPLSLYYIWFPPVAQVAIHGDVAKFNGDLFSIHIFPVLHDASTLLKLTFRVLRTPFGWGVCCLLTAHPDEADGFNRLRDTCQTCWKWFFCFVTCWIDQWDLIPEYLSLMSDI